MSLMWMVLTWMLAAAPVLSGSGTPQQDWHTTYDSPLPQENTHNGQETPAITHTLTLTHTLSHTHTHPTRSVPPLNTHSPADTQTPDSPDLAHTPHTHTHTSPHRSTNTHNTPHTPITSHSSLSHTRQSHTHTPSNSHTLSNTHEGRATTHTQSHTFSSAVTERTNTPSRSPSHTHIPTEHTHSRTHPAEHTQTHTHTAALSTSSHGDSQSHSEGRSPRSIRDRPLVTMETSPAGTATGTGTGTLSLEMTSPLSRQHDNSGTAVVTETQPSDRSNAAPHSSAAEDLDVTNHTQTESTFLRQNIVNHTQTSSRDIVNHTQTSTLYTPDHKQTTSISTSTLQTPGNHTQTSSTLTLRTSDRTSTLESSDPQYAAHTHTGFTPTHTDTLIGTDDSHTNTQRDTSTNAHTHTFPNTGALTHTLKDTNTDTYTLSDANTRTYNDTRTEVPELDTHTEADIGNALTHTADIHTHTTAPELHTTTPFPHTHTAHTTNTPLIHTLTPQTHTHGTDIQTHTPSSYSPPLPPSSSPPLSTSSFPSQSLPLPLSPSTPPSHSPPSSPFLSPAPTLPTHTQTPTNTQTLTQPSTHTQPDTHTHSELLPTPPTSHTHTSPPLTHTPTLTHTSSPLTHTHAHVHTTACHTHTSPQLTDRHTQSPAPWPRPQPTSSSPDWTHRGRVIIQKDQSPHIKEEYFQLLLQVEFEENCNSRMDTSTTAWMGPYLMRAAGYRSTHLTWSSGCVFQSVCVFHTASSLSWLRGPESVLQEVGLTQALEEGLIIQEVRVKNITVGGFQGEVCDWLLQCGDGFQCVPIGGNFTCRSRCHSPFCHNQGICIHRPGQQPSCQCPVGDDWWYMGVQCDVRMTQQRIVGLCLSAVVAMAIAMGLLCYLVIRRFKMLLIEAKIEQTRSSYRRFNHFDELSARYWSRGGSCDSCLDNPAPSCRSDQWLQLRAAQRSCCNHDDTLSLCSSAAQLNTIYGSQYGWQVSNVSLADGVLDSGKASDLSIKSDMSIKSYEIEPIQWTPYPLLHTLSQAQSQRRSYCEGMELVELERSWTA
ncbi:mucin-2 isoform X2 [Engraulis encrasicolus]|uniref:mucin-2 isoform X2 n=1 Tax=Engraulis encrasicolus TaxID=184585 RepID=UPI002FD1D541